MSLFIRSIDIMSQTKDLLDTPNSSTVTDNLITSLNRDYDLTHIAISVPMNTNAESTAERGGEFAIEPVVYAKQFADKIHAVGLNVLWRATDCYLEGIYSFPKWDGSARKRVGFLEEVTGTAITNDFSVANLSQNFLTDHQTGNDWSITGGELVGPAGSGWVRTCLTKQSFLDVTMVAKVKKVGHQQIVVRATRDSNFPGYGLQMRNTNILRIERPGLASLGQVSKTWVEGNWYYLKLQAIGTSIKGKSWADGDSEPGTWDIEVTDSSYSGGYCGFSGESSNGHFDDMTVTPEAYTDSWMGRIYNYIIDNQNLFANGDIWAPLPEATGHGIFNDSTSFLPDTYPGLQANYRDFFKELKRVSDYAFSQVGKSGVETGQTGHNWSEINSGWMPSGTHGTYVCFDHYGTGGADYAASELTSDWNSTYSSLQKPMFHQEWGDYWSTNADYGYSRNQSEHETYLGTIYSAMQDQVDAGKIIGFNYWRGGADTAHENIQANEGTTESPDYQPTYEGDVLASFFSDNSGASAPAGWGQPDTPVSAPGLLTVNSTNSRYFENPDGDLVFLSGYCTWENFQNRGSSDPPDDFDFTGLLDLLEASGCNYIRGIFTQCPKQDEGGALYTIPNPWSRTGAGTAADDKAKFDLDVFDDEFFTTVRSRIVEAGERGIYCSIQFFQGWSVNNYQGGTEFWGYHPFDDSNNVNSIDGDSNDNGKGEEIETLTPTDVTAYQEAYVEHFVDELNDLDNFFWEIANEPHQAQAARDWQEHFVDHLHTYEATKDQQHLVLMSDVINGGNWAWMLSTSSAEIIAPGNDGTFTTPIAVDGTKVVIGEMDHITGSTPDFDWLWKAFCQGSHVSFLDTLNGTAAELKARANAGYILSYANRIDLVNMTPQSGLSDSGYCLADASATGEYLAYVDDSSDITLDISSTPGLITVEWLDTTDGSINVVGNINPSNPNAVFSNPFSNAAVLYVKSAEVSASSEDTGLRSTSGARPTSAVRPAG